MYLDSQLEFSDAQAVTASAASENIIDLGSAQVNAGVGEELYLVVQVQTAMTDVGSDSTVAVTLEGDDNEAFASATTVQTIGTFAATSAAGTKLVARLQPEAITERFLRIQYTVAGGDLTTGSFDAAIVHTAQLDDYFPIGYTVS